MGEKDLYVIMLQDGGVFSCGAGMYGQLGHGTKVNEILPRQIMELMGSTVTQVSHSRQYFYYLLFIITVFHLICERSMA